MADENIRKAISAAQAEIDPVLKIQKDKIQYTVVEYQDVVAAVRPAMVKHGIVATVIDLTIHSFDRFVIPKDPADKYPKEKTEYMAVVVGVVRFSHAESDTYVDNHASTSVVAYSDKVLQIADTNIFKIGLLQTFLVQSEDVGEAGKNAAVPQAKPETEKVQAAQLAIFSDKTDQMLLAQFNGALDKLREAVPNFMYKEPKLHNEAVANVYKLFGEWMSKEQFKTVTTLMADGKPDDAFWNAITNLHDTNPLLLMLAGKLLNR